MDKVRMLEYYKMFSTREFEEANHYQGDDLGAIWTKEETRFRIWAPTAEKVFLNLYKTGHQEDLIQTIPMVKAVRGTWLVTVKGDQQGVYYTYTVTVDGETKETIDPYAKAVGVNGKRGMVVDLLSTNPEGFLEETKPDFINSTDAIIYELHIRDFSSDESSGMRYKGKYLAFTETDTRNESGASTGTSYLKELGITHVHLLPAFDYKTVDEARLEEPQYNWGYDPFNFNVPEGSYSTDPFHGEVRIKEFKQMVQALHKNGIRVIMDVVYNHTMEREESHFNRIVPGYYYRLTQDGSFSNASGCGNETASERVMMRKYIIDSLIYWVKEYHVDGFRFDLMGIHDTKTMMDIRKALDEIEPGLLMYGEGWTGGLSPLPDWERALKVNIKHMDTRIAAFNDNLRDGIKGSVFDHAEGGYISGRNGLEDTIKFGVVGATQHEWIDYPKVLYSNGPWATEPTQCVNYTSSHDNLTLWDKINLSTPWASREERVKMNLLSAAIILTCQGIPFFQGGEEFLRSKPADKNTSMYVENSYCSPDSVNCLKWSSITENRVVVEYYKGLIAFRKNYSSLRMTKTQDIEKKLTFLKWLETNLIAYIITSETEGDICVIYNANRESKPVHVPEGKWKVYVKGTQAGTQVIENNTGGVVLVEPISTLIMVKECNI